MYFFIKRTYFLLSEPIIETVSYNEQVPLKEPPPPSPVQKMPMKVLPQGKDQGSLYVKMILMLQKGI